jgi:predicted adenylyl cyclase CyaB
MSHFEIEVKSLLGSEESAARLKARMCELDPECVMIGSNTQLNHYFEGGDVQALYDSVEMLFDDEQKAKLKIIIERGTEFSIRTRQKEDEVFLVVKASIDEGTSANTVKRMEFEEAVDIALPELDQLLINAGFTYQAKWSRAREEYSYKGANVCLDKNAGYGYLAEVEKIVHDESLADQVREEIDAVMAELELIELEQDRLARMFAHYNANWPDYYGTDRIFIIE